VVIDKKKIKDFKGMKKHGRPRSKSNSRTTKYLNNTKNKIV
jgi:hypothetical protein